MSNIKLRLLETLFEVNMIFVIITTQILITQLEYDIVNTLMTELSNKQSVIEFFSELYMSVSLLIQVH